MSGLTLSNYPDLTPVIAVDDFCAHVNIFVTVNPVRGAILANTSDGSETRNPICTTHLPFLGITQLQAALIS